LAAIGVLGAALVAFGVYIFWCDYSFQQEKMSGSAIVLDKTQKDKQAGKYWAGTSYQLLCKLNNDAQNHQCWLYDQHDHWSSIRRGDQIQVQYRKSNPADMRLRSGSDSWPLAGILYCVFGVLLSACGGIPLAAAMGRAST
jgi:uncharacterized protein DUF3592